jgi:hypothetical protein
MKAEKYLKALGGAKNIVKGGGRRRDPAAGGGQGPRQGERGRGGGVRGHVWVDDDTVHLIVGSTPTSTRRRCAPRWQGDGPG